MGACSPVLGSGHGMAHHRRPDPAVRLSWAAAEEASVMGVTLRRSSSYCRRQQHRGQEPRSALLKPPRGLERCSSLRCWWWERRGLGNEGEEEEEDGQAARRKNSDGGPMGNSETTEQRRRPAVGRSGGPPSSSRPHSRPPLMSSKVRRDGGRCRNAFMCVRRPRCLARSATGLVFAS